jgi:predicted O-methyltransferase YrrM
MDLLKKIIYFIRFYQRAVTIYDLHSPLLTKYLLPLFYGKAQHLKLVERRRKILLKDKRQLKKAEFGAGSVFQKSSFLFISKMTAFSAVSSSEGYWLALLANHAPTKTILELGTHFGLSSAYMASLNKMVHIYTIEGCPETAAIATETFNQLKLKDRIHQQIGTFEEILPSFLPHSPPIDLLFIDGNHRGKALRHYLKICSPFISQDGIIVLSDIYWSEDMQETWHDIYENYSLFHVIDLFHFGILIPRKNNHWERYKTSVIHFRYKPWRLGFI